MADANPTQGAQALATLIAGVRDHKSRLEKLEATGVDNAETELSIRETLTQVGAQLEALSNSLYMLLTVDIAKVAPYMDSEDPEVAKEAESQAKLLMQCQARIMPQYYEDTTGFSATTGEVLPGRTAFVALPELTNP